MKKAFKIIGIIIGIGVLLYVVVGLFLYLYLGKAFEFADAADRGDIPAMEKMIAEGYNPAKTYFGVDQLTHYLSRKENRIKQNTFNIDAVKFMLKNKVSPNGYLKSVVSTLQMSLMFNNDELIKILLEAGADVNYTTPKKHKNLSAVDIAMIFNKYHLLPLLESYGGKPNSIILPEGYANASACVSNPECKAKLTEQHYKIK